MQLRRRCVTLFLGVAAGQIVKPTIQHQMLSSAAPVLADSIWDELRQLVCMWIESETSEEEVAEQCAEIAPKLKITEAECERVVEKVWEETVGKMCSKRMIGKASGQVSAPPEIFQTVTPSARASPISIWDTMKELICAFFRKNADEQQVARMICTDVAAKNQIPEGECELAVEMVWEETVGKTCSPSNETVATGHVFEFPTHPQISTSRPWVAPNSIWDEIKALVCALMKAGNTEEAAAKKICPELSAKLQISEAECEMAVQLTWDEAVGKACSPSILV